MARRSSLRGKQEALDAFGALERAITRRIIPDALRAGLGTLASAMRAEAPRGKTGELAAMVVVGRIRVGKRRIVGEATASADHAAAVDLGTSSQRSNPFVLRVARRLGPRVLNDATKRIARAIEAQAKG